MSQSTGAASQPPAGIGAVDRYFKISERGSTVAREVRGGLVSFFAMAYIIILNPLILGSGVDVEGNQLSIVEIAAVTALAATALTLTLGACQQEQTAGGSPSVTASSSASRIIGRSSGSGWPRRSRTAST